MTNKIQPKSTFWNLTQEGETYRQMGYYHKAIYPFAQALELKSDDAWVNAHFGATWHQLKLYHIAKGFLETATSQNPGYAWAWAQRGENYHYLREVNGDHHYQEALDCFNKAIDLNPLYARAWAHRGTTKHRMTAYHNHARNRVKDLLEARADFLTAADINSDYAWAWACLGIADVMLAREYQDLGDSEAEAETTLKAFSNVMTAINLDPQVYGDHPNEVGMMLGYLRQYRQAIVCYEQAFDQNAAHYVILYNLAVTTARYKESIGEGIEAALPEINIARSALQMELAQKQAENEDVWQAETQTFLKALGKAGQMVEAMIASTKLAATSAENRVEQSGILYRLGGLAHLEGKEKEALEYLIQALSMDKHVLENVDAHYDIAWPKSWDKQDLLDFAADSDESSQHPPKRIGGPFPD